MYEYEYPRPAVSVDMLVLRGAADQREILLIQRLNEPFSNCWALPGGFLEMDETLEQAARRELAEETGLVAESVRQIRAFSNVDRDPRGRVISVAFLVQLAGDQVPVAADDAKHARWFPVIQLPDLAFDHEQIIAAGLALN